MCFTLGANTTTYPGVGAKNITFENNEIRTTSLTECIRTTDAENVIIRNNKFESTAVYEAAVNYIFIRNVNGKNVIFENNNVKIDATGGDSIKYVAFDITKVNNNKIEVNTNIAYGAFWNFEQMNNNEIIINKDVYRFLNNPITFTGNKVIVQGLMEVFTQYYNSDMKADSIISNNNIVYNYDEIGNNKKSTLITINNAKINDHMITFNQNTVIGEKISTASKLIGISSIVDAISQTVKIENNNLSIYKVKSGGTGHNIVIKNNIIDGVNVQTI